MSNLFGWTKLVSYSIRFFVVWLNDVMALSNIIAREYILEAWLVLELETLAKSFRKTVKCFVATNEKHS